MNFLEWQKMTGAYMPSWDERMDIAIANVRSDEFGRFPLWYIFYCIGREFAMRRTR